MNSQAYERITGQIIALLEQGTVPWQKSWKASTELPRNIVSNKPYRGINVLLLLAMNYESPYWLTFRQAIQLGGSVKKGEKSCPVVFWKRFTVEDKETEEEREIPLLRYYHVFNVAQCEGIRSDLPPAKDSVADSVIDNCQKIFANMPQKPAVKEGFTQAFYSLSEDYIGMPRGERFLGSKQYYATLFHELIHSTGHESRLKRLTKSDNDGFGSDPYCKEELVAEIGAAFLCGHAEILERTIDNSAAYIAGWLKQLKNDNTLIVHAAAQAQRAADFVLGRTFDEKGDVASKN